MASYARTKHCDFRDCMNTSENSNVIFHRFPRANYKEWIVLCENQKLLDVKLETLLTHHFVCEDHFRKDQYRRILSPFRRFLKRGEVPNTKKELSQAAVAIPKSENPPITKMVKNEVPDDELEFISVKEEPVDWHQEPQDQMNAASFALTLKKEVDNAWAEACTEQAEAEDELESSSDACNTYAVHRRLAGAFQGSADLLLSDVSGSGSGVEVNPPVKLESVRFLCAHCDYSSTRKNELELHLRDEHKLGLNFKCKPSSYSGLHSNKSKLRLKVNYNVGIKSKSGSVFERNLMERNATALRAVKQIHNCEFCDYSSVYKSSIKRHQSRKHNEKLFKCEQCAFTTTCRKYSTETPLRCELCAYITM